ncbi:hypothetical protein DID78_00015 [Candidatus Marinamargulisbacteria bacterium SCGC AG-343-D04]|nr:hypothetical protein DID78_00015 [Candidatus Marinamargulisbacteria bacterium SCGC AG-343-D04]
MLRGLNQIIQLKVILSCPEVSRRLALKALEISEDPEKRKVMSQLIAPFMRPYILGHDIKSSFESADNLQQQKDVSIIFDYAGEYATTDLEREKNLEYYHKSIGDTEHPSVRYFAIKYTGIVNAELLGQTSLNSTEKKTLEIELERVTSLCQLASDKKKTLFIDAEGFNEETRILGHVKTLLPQFNKKEALIYPTFQMYRKDSIERLLELKRQSDEEDFICSAKIVNGAYHANDSRLFPDQLCTKKEDSHANFLEALHIAAENKIDTVVATHNPSLMEAAVKLKFPRMTLGQLYGMETSIPQSYTAKNRLLYGVSGDKEITMPYFLRRIVEHTESSPQILESRIGFLKKHLIETFLSPWK